MALRLFKLRSIAAYAPELEGRGPQALGAAATTATTTSATPTPETSGEVLENVGGKIKNNEETVLELLNYLAARKILKTKPKVNDVKPLNKEVKKEKDVEVLLKNPEEIPR